MNNNISNNSKFKITYDSNNISIDISNYESLGDRDSIELANIINNAYNDGYKTVIDCKNLNIFSDTFYNSVENLSSLNFNISGQEISYDEIVDAINNNYSSSSYTYSNSGSGDDSISLDYASINHAVTNLSSVVDNSDLTNIKNQINSLNPCYKELPSSGCIGKITANVANCISTVNGVYNRLVNFRNYLRERDANYDYYANIQYIEGLDDFGEGLTDVEKYHVVEEKMKEIQEYQNVGSEKGMISSEVHQTVLDACVNYLDYYGYTGTEWILNKSKRTQEDQKFIDGFYNNYSQKEQSKLSDLQLYTLVIISQDKAEEVSEEYLSTHEDMVGSSFEEILAGRQAAIDSYTEEHAGYAIDDISNAIFAAGKKKIEDKYDECEYAYKEYLEYLEVGNSSIETIYRREYAAKLPAGISAYNSDYYSEYLTADKSDFLISRDLKHSDDKIATLNTEVNELSNEFNALTKEKESLASQLTPQNTIDNILYFFGKYSNENKSEINDKISEIDKKLNAISIEMTSKKSQLDFIDKNSFNLYTKFSNFNELCNSNIADYKISTNFWGNQVIDFYDKDGNKLDISTEEGAIYIYTNQISFDKDIVTDEYGNVIDEKNSYSRELKKMMNDVNQFKFDSAIDVDYFKVLNYLDNTGNDTKFQYYYDRKYDDCLRIEGKLLADARTNVLDAHCSFVDFFSLTGWGLVDGVNQFIDGFVNLVSADGKPSAEQYMSMYMAEYVNDNYSYSEIMQGAYEISVSMGNMLPSIAASFIPMVGPFLGSALMGLSATGNSVEEGLQQGMTSAEAWVYGILSGASEVLLQRVLGGIPGISNMERFAGMHGLTGLVFKGLSESLEESCQEVLNPVFKYLVTGDWDGIDADNVIKAGVYAFITAGIMNGGSFITDVASMSMFGDYTAIGHVINKYSGVDLYKVSHDELTKSIKNDFKILKNSKKGLSSLVKDLSQNETIKNAYESLSDEQKEIIKFNDYVSGIAIDSTLLVGKSTTSETVNAEAVKKINLELEELNNTKVKIEEDIKVNQEARNNTTDLAESLKLDEELAKLNEQLNDEENGVNAQIASKTDELNVYSLATSLLDPKQFALLLATDPVTANNVYLTASLASAFNMEETEIVKSEEVIGEKEEAVAEDIVAETTVDETIKGAEVQVEYDQEKIDLELKAIDKLRKQIDKLRLSALSHKYEHTNNTLLKNIYKSKLEKNQARIFELAGPCIRSIDGMIKNGVESTIDGNSLGELRNEVISKVIMVEVGSLMETTDLYYGIDDTYLANPQFNDYLKKSIISVADKLNLGVGDIIYSLRCSRYFNYCGYYSIQEFFENLSINFFEEYFREGKIDAATEIMRKTFWDSPQKYTILINSFLSQNYADGLQLVKKLFDGRILISKYLANVISSIISQDYKEGLQLAKDGIKKGVLANKCGLSEVINVILSQNYVDGFQLAKDEINKGRLTDDDLANVIINILSKSYVEGFEINKVIEIANIAVEKEILTGYDLSKVIVGILPQNYSGGFQLAKDGINKGSLTGDDLANVINEILCKSYVEGFEINEVVDLVNIAVEKEILTGDNLAKVINNILPQNCPGGFQLAKDEINKGSLTGDNLANVIVEILYQNCPGGFQLAKDEINKGSLTGYNLANVIVRILSQNYSGGFQLAKDEINKGSLTDNDLANVIHEILCKSDVDGFKINEVVDLVNIAVNKEILTGSELYYVIKNILSKSNVEGFEINKVIEIANIAVEKEILTGCYLANVIINILSKSDIEGFKINKVVALVNDAMEKRILTDKNLGIVINAILSKNEAEGLRMIEDYDKEDLSDVIFGILQNNISTTVANKLLKDFHKRLNFDAKVKLARYSDNPNIKKLCNSNSPMLHKFFVEFYCYLLNDENAIEFNTDLLINIFESQKIPEFYKRLMVYKFIYDGGSLEMLNNMEGSRKVQSEVLLSLPNDGERLKLLTQDVLTVAIESHSDSLYEFFANIEDAFLVVDNIKLKENLSIDNLTTEEKQTISYLLDLYYSYETMNGGRIIDLSDKGFSDSDLISELDTILNMGKEEYLTKLFGIDYNPEIAKKMNTTYMDEYIRNTDKQNREFAKNIGNDVVMVKKGTSYKGAGLITYIESLLQEGVLCPEFFGLTANSNTTPLDIDCWDTPKDMPINLVDESKFGFCDIFIKEASKYKYERIDREKGFSKPTSFYRTGIAASDIEFLSLPSKPESLAELESLKFELVKKGLYIPIVSGYGGTGKIIFTPEEFDILRSKYLNGLSTYGMGDYVFDSSVANSDASKIFSMLSKEGMQGENEFLNIPIIKNIINNASSTSQNISEDTKVFLERISGSEFVGRESIITSFEEMNFKSLSMEDAIELYKKLKSGELDFMYDQSMSDSQKLLLLQKMSDLDIQVKSNAVHKWFENKLQVATKELGMTDLEIKEFIDKVIFAGSLELIDTGSTSRGANFPGDGDFDFIIRTDLELLEDTEKFNALINKIFGKSPVKNAVKHYSINVDYNGNESLNNSEKDSFTLDGDFSFIKKHDLGTLSTEGALYERYKSMEYDRETRAQVIANVWLCKKLLKQAGVYKKADNGLGGVGVENLILHNGGSLDKAARSILEASRTITYEDYKKRNPNGNFISYLKDTSTKKITCEEFINKYHIIDVGENHYNFDYLLDLKRDKKTDRKQYHFGYVHDDFINTFIDELERNVDTTIASISYATDAYQKTIDAFEQYVRSLSYDLGGLDMSIPDANPKSIETSTDTDISKKIGMSLEEIQALENIPIEIIQEIFEGTDYYRRLMELLSNN